MKPEPHFKEDLPGIIPVETPKSSAVIELHPPVRDVDRVQRGRIELAKVFAEREIECRMPRQIPARIGRAGKGIAEPRPIVNISRDIRPPWKRHVGANVQGIALIMIERAKPGAGIAEIGSAIRQPSSDCPPAISNLIGGCEINLSAMRNARRAQRKFPSSNERLLNRQRKEKIRLSDHVVVEEVIDARAERVGIERPSTKRHGDAKLKFFVALAMQRDELASILRAKLLQSSGGGQQRRRLIVMSVESAERPAQPRNRNRSAKTR